MNMTNTSEISAEEIIHLLHLEPLPVEGGYFDQYYRSSEYIPAAALPERYGHDKLMGTGIYFLRTTDPDSFSALHFLPTDEIHHFYLGDPVETLLLYADGHGEVVVLGQDIRQGQKLQMVVPAGVWQGGRLAPGGRWALIGATMAPGFDEQDYQGGSREDLIGRYPQFKERIKQLTRPGENLRMIS
jgi:uncharacterized protein